MVRHLGRIKHVSSRYFNCSFSSFNSSVAIIYGRIYKGRVSGRISIPKSISLLWGTPSSSSRKTFENSLTTGTKSIGGSQH